MVRDFSEPGSDGELPAGFQEWQRGATSTVQPTSRRADGTLSIASSTWKLACCARWFCSSTLRRRRRLHFFDQGQPRRLPVWHLLGPARDPLPVESNRSARCELAAQVESASSPESCHFALSRQHQIRPLPPAPPRPLLPPPLEQLVPIVAWP